MIWSSQLLEIEGNEGGVALINSRHHQEQPWIRCTLHNTTGHLYRMDKWKSGRENRNRFTFITDCFLSNSLYTIPNCTQLPCYIYQLHVIYYSLMFSCREVARTHMGEQRCLQSFFLMYTICNFYSDWKWLNLFLFKLSQYLQNFALDLLKSVCIENVTCNGRHFLEHSDFDPCADLSVMVWVSCIIIIIF